MNYLAASGRGISEGFLLISPQGAGNITQEIPRLRSGSVRLHNFSSLSFLKLKSH